MNKTLLIIFAIVIFAGAAFLIVKPLFRQASPPDITPAVSSTTSPSLSPTPVPPSPPQASSPKGIVEGHVLLGPTCPVERVPPDPGCAPKGYQTTIHIRPANSATDSITISTDASGAFSVSLAPGLYTFKPVGSASMLPRCTETPVRVTSGQTQTQNLDCDTGIR